MLQETTAACLQTVLLVKKPHRSLFIHNLKNGIISCFSLKFCRKVLTITLNDKNEYVKMPV